MSLHSKILIFTKHLALRDILRATQFYEFTQVDLAKEHPHSLQIFDAIRNYNYNENIFLLQGLQSISSKMLFLLKEHTLYISPLEMKLNVVDVH